MRRGKTHFCRFPMMHCAHPQRRVPESHVLAVQHNGRVSTSRIQGEPNTQMNSKDTCNGPTIKHHVQLDKPLKQDYKISAVDN